jgi:hypothetical protein
VTHAVSPLRLMAACAGLVVLVDGEPPARAMRAPPVPAHPVALVAGGGALPGGYGLAVTGAVPPPPGAPAASVAPAGAASASGRAACPIEVRAVVEGEEPGDSFAVVVAGGESRLLRLGEGLKAGAKRLAVARIEAGAVTLRTAEGSIRCDFAN